ncbi:cell division protein PerM [Amycolatopsis minnesotensis]
MLLATSERQEGDELPPEPGDGDALTGAARTRAVLAAALSPLVTGYLVVAALLALVTAIASQAQFSTTGVLFAAAPAWLAAYQVPVEIAGQQLGVLPLLATIGVCLLVARAAGNAAQRLGYREPGRAVPLVAVIAGAHAVAGTVVAVVVTSPQLDVEPLPAFGAPALLSALSAVAGVAPRCGARRVLHAYLDPIAIRGLRAGALGLAGLVLCGAVVFTVSSLLSFSTMRELFAAGGPGFGSGAGMTLLSLGYLPNAVVGGLGFAAGPGFSIGGATVSAFGYTGGPVPALPLLAGVPESQAGWWPVFLLLPLAVGALVGWTLRAIDPDPVVRLRTVAVAGALVGFGCVLLCTFAGGRLGGGAFDPVSMSAVTVSLAAFCWIVIPGGFVAWLAGPSAPEPAAEEPAAEEAVAAVPAEEPVEAPAEEAVEESFDEAHEEPFAESEDTWDDLEDLEAGMAEEEEEPEPAETGEGAGDHSEPEPEAATAEHGQDRADPEVEPEK